jgi:L-seryl-tRNA(Ser) seleniumtransferase
MNDLLRQLPSVDRLLSEPDVEPLVDAHGHEQVVFYLRRALDSLRQEILKGSLPADTNAEGLRASVLDDLHRGLRPSIRHAINAAGVILHTGLGRALMPAAAVDAVVDTIHGYCTLATDLEQGRRMTRDEHYRDLLCTLTGAEAATVVVNNAAATMLILNTLAQGKEVIVSRGQLVEIGGSFRMPDVMEMSGAVLREVGTTNKTHLRDYERAIGDNTGAILRVHQSNYRILGFTSEPDIAELADLGRKHNLPVVDDLGSGALVDLRQFGLTPEPLVQDSVKAGATASCFSGDKLIGGPQCGIIVGTRDAIDRIKRNPLARAMRIGKMTVAALEATLRLFLNQKELFSKHPTYRMFSLPLETLRRRAEAVSARLADVAQAEIAIEPGETEIGSGSAAIEKLPSVVLSIRPKQMTVDELARRLRYHEPPVFTRIQHDAIICDFRTVQPEEDQALAEAIRTVLTESE